MKSLYKIVAAVAVLAPVQANAVTANIPFNGTVNNTCAISVTGSGVIVPNATYDQMSSTFAGGSAGTAQLLVTGNGTFDVSVDAPAAWSTAPASAAGSTFSTTYDLSGANTASGVAGSTATTLNNGNTNVAVNLTADSPGGPFEAGTYSAVAVLRCE